MRFKFIYKVLENIIVINKPVVILVMRDINSLTGQGDIFREALISCLKNTLGCEALAYSLIHDFTDDLAKVKGVIESKKVVAVIIQEDEYDEDLHQIVVKQVRVVDKNLPIIIFPHRDKEDVKGIEGFKRIYFYCILSKRVIPLLKRWLKKMVVPLDFFGAQNQQEVERVSDCLANAYQKQYLDGRELAVPDYNHQVVAEAMRVRLTKELIQEEFDSTLGREPKMVSASDIAVYEKEVALIKQMCAKKEGQNDLWNLLHNARGYMSPGSQGDNVEGFAIEPVTLEYSRTAGFGCHQLARDRLEYRLEYLIGLNGGKSFRRRKYPSNRIISGLFFPEVDGFKIPIVQFREIEENDKDSLKGFFTDTRLAIPLIFDGDGFCPLGCHEEKSFI